MKKILIFGAGVLGSWYGWELSQKDLSLTLFARKDQAERIRSSGINIHNSKTGEDIYWNPESVISEAEGHFDLILVFVRAGQIEEALTELKHFTGNPPVLFMGNTVTSHIESVKVLGKHRVLTGMAGVGGYRDIGKIIISPFNHLVLGAPFIEARQVLATVMNQMERSISQTSTGKLSYST